ncbi:MAG: hypothetical protein KAS36_14320 [Anaerolineales bacterium]|nr:hypothetical protein [Anaerolineales bacterium]
MSEIGEPQLRRFAPIGTEDSSYAPSVVGVPTDGDQLTYNASIGRWEPITAASTEQAQLLAGMAGGSLYANNLYAG